MSRRCSTSVFWLSLILLGHISVKAEPEKQLSIHTVFTTECDTYFNWQTIGIFHSFQLTKQPGPITRLLSCSEDRKKVYQDVDVDIPTHWAPSWSIHPKTGDMYSGINKPVALRDWLQKVQPPEDIIIVIDADTILRKVLDPVSMGVKPGWAVAGFYGYMKGVANAMALKHVPQVEPRNDSIAGPVGRRGDQVGGFVLMYTQDLVRMADDWVSVTEDVRADPDAWETSGDVYTPNKGDKPWIAEMYGYSFGASKNDIWHNTNNEFMLYPGYTPAVLQHDPSVLHYGVSFYIDYRAKNGSKATWSFDKHHYTGFDPLKCPPWDNNLGFDGKRKFGVFEAVPHPEQLLSEGVKLFRDLLSSETIATLNEALCLRHLKKCPPSQELNDTCNEVFELAKAVRAAQAQLLSSVGPPACQDKQPQCGDWAAAGECTKNLNYMSANCQASCGLCTPDKQVKPPVNVTVSKNPAEIAAQNQDLDKQQQKSVEQQETSKQGSNANMTKQPGSKNKTQDVTRHLSEQNDTENTTKEPLLKITDRQGNLIKWQTVEEQVKSATSDGTETVLRHRQRRSNANKSSSPLPPPAEPQLAKDEGGGQSVLDAALKKCQNHDTGCERWADKGECEKNPGYMLKTCVKACNYCQNLMDPEEQAAYLTYQEGLRQQAESEEKSQQLYRMIDRCTQHPNYSMDQVQECFTQAKEGKEYKVPEAKHAQSLSATLKSSGNVRPGMAHRSPAIKSVRKLKEKAVGSKDFEEGEMEWSTIFILGGLLLAVILGLRRMVPFTRRRRPARQKGY